MRTLANILAISLLLTLAGQVEAYEVDAPQRALAAKNYERWKQEDEQINKRLEDSRKQHGRPNIIFILTDDIGWGELGSYGGGKLRGTPTPNLDTLASQGIKFLQHYAEPSCTPTRVALMTGRLPIRTGLDEVLFPGQDKGLAAEEYTLAELLRDSGYRTAMFGKWHLGEKPEHQPTSQGFDYALYTMYNGGPWPWKENSHYYDADNETIGEVPYELDMPQDYEERYNIKLHGIMESRKGEKPKQIAELSLERYNIHENELTDAILSYVEESSKADKPFFVYWASNANQVFFCPPEERRKDYVDSGNCQAAQLAQHDKNVQRVVDKLKELNIEHNTLLVWVSDNGPMYSFFPSAGFTYLRGQKHEVYEGGVRTPALARWPGVIAASSDPVDLVHVTDWYTTIARIADASKHIPRDRIIDGVDQTALLLAGEGHSRRDYVLHYQYSFFGKRGAVLGAVRMGDLKFHLNKQPIEIYNIKRDPKEQFSYPSKYLWALLPLRRTVWEHETLMKKYPNRVLEETVGSKMMP